MKIIVDTHKITLEKDEIVNAGEYNIQDCNFEFSEEYDNLVKVAIFSSQTNSFKVNINNTNKCIIPYEVLENENIITIGVYGYEIDGEELIKRYSPSPEHFKVEDGSYKLGEEVDPPSPSIIEQIQEEIEQLNNEVSAFDEEQEIQNINILNLQEFKVDKVIGKGLSTNDYTNEEKQKLSNLENYDDTEIRGLISEKQDQLTAGENITIENNVISATNNGGVWGSITGTLSDQIDLKNVLDSKANSSDIPDVSNFITKDVNNLTYYTLKTNTGSLIDLEVNSSTYVVTLRLKDIDGNVISTDTIDLPLESVVVSGSFDSTNKKIVLTLQNGNTVDIPVGDLVAGLQTEITSQNKIASDLIDDTNSGNKFVTTSDITNWNNKIDSSALTNYVQNTDYATLNTGGVIKTNPGQNFVINGAGAVFANTSSYGTYQTQSNSIFISKGTLENVIAGKDLTTKAYVDGLVGDINTALDLLNGEVI